MELLEQLTTLKGFSESKFKEKGSLFLGQAYPAVSEEETVNILETVRKEFYDATHHCYGYKFADGSFKYSDAGEPSGTAGVRILNAIEHFDLLNVFVVIIRYYGGTKLGVGPLGKAYYNSTLLALENAEKIEKICYQTITLLSGFSEISKLHHFLNMFEAKIINTEYSEKVKFECLIKPKFFKPLCEKLIEATHGSISLISSGNCSFL